jgi:CheY-like chemotaxis protein/HPt (histidine-containing phosphotransfer) domain-containing protein
LGVIQDLQHLRKIGFAECVTKPIMQTALLDALAFLVEGDSVDKPRQRLGRKDVPQVDGIPRTNHKGARLLLAEDNEINQQVALEVLAHAGYQCDVVDDGRQAFEAIKKIRYDVVLMDCQMPEMDGFAATRLIRERERMMVQDAPPLPIIALTANAFKGEQEKCLAAGMTDYLSKPFEPAQLVCTIEMYLDRAANTGAPHEPAPALVTTSTPQSEIQAPPQEVVKPVVREAVKANETQRVVRTEERREQPAIKHESDGPAAVVDFESLLKRCLGNKELPKKLLTKFHARLPEELRQINEAVAARDSAQISAMAHRLKGAAANLSAEPMREAAAELELIGRNGDLTDAEMWLARLNTEGTRFLRDVLQLAADRTALWQKTETSREMTFGEIQCVS